jgi:hypothetical protein
MPTGTRRSGVPAREELECRKLLSSTWTGHCWTPSISTRSPGTKRWRSSATLSASSRPEARSAREATSSFPYSSQPTTSGTTAKIWRNGAANVSKTSICRWCARSRRYPICFDACGTPGSGSPSLHPPRRMNSANISTSRTSPTWSKLPRLPRMPRNPSRPRTSSK